jgi:hypothetical protein
MKAYRGLSLIFSEISAFAMVRPYNFHLTVNFMRLIIIITRELLLLSVQFTVWRLFSLKNLFLDINVIENYLEKLFSSFL